MKLGFLDYNCLQTDMYSNQLDSRLMSQIDQIILLTSNLIGTQVLIN